MFANDRFQRPTYERDAEDDEFATANGLSMPRFDQQRRDLPQARTNAGRFGTMAFAMPPAQEVSDTAQSAVPLRTAVPSEPVRHGSCQLVVSAPTLLCGMLDAGRHAPERHRHN